MSVCGRVHVVPDGEVCPEHDNRVEVNPCRVRRGIVTTHPDLSSLGSGPHFAATCCGAGRCQRRLSAAAEAATGLTATYVSDESRKPSDAVLVPRPGADPDAIAIGEDNLSLTRAEGLLDLLGNGRSTVQAPHGPEPTP